MKTLFITLMTAACIVAAQSPSKTARFHVEPGLDDADWLDTSFDDRARLFDSETRDFDWAPNMERSIKEKVAELDRPLTEVFGEELCNRLPMCQKKMPSVHLAYLECRTTVCSIEMHWPPGTPRSIIGQQVSLLSELGVNHQGWSQGGDDGTRVQSKMFLLRRM